MPTIRIYSPVLLLTILLLASVSLHAAAPWELVWADEFNTNGLPDPGHWKYETGFIRNNEAQYYTAGRAQNARVENGKLIIEARKEHFSNPDYRPGSRRGRNRPFAEYTSASLTTRGTRSWKYGRVEVRAKLPKGRGVWPAIWLLGDNESRVGWPKCGEIDLMEYVGFDPETVHANIHTGKYNHVRGTGKGDQCRVEKPYDSFHNYIMEWRPDRLDFFVDDHKYFTYPKAPDAGKDAWPYDQPFFLIINLAIGGEWGAQKGVDDSIFPARYEIDYVRVYQEKSDKPD
jgi:beta-glucanase (GH16 family)